jgi:hypothetical protein
LATGGWRPKSTVYELYKRLSDERWHRRAELEKITAGKADLEDRLAKYDAVASTEDFGLWKRKTIGSGSNSLKGRILQKREPKPKPSAGSQRKHKLSPLPLTKSEERPSAFVIFWL